MTDEGQRRAKRSGTGWRAPRSGGYSARPGGEKPPPPTGPGAASDPAPPVTAPTEEIDQLRAERDQLRAWADDLAAKVPPHVDGDESQEALTTQWVSHVGLIHCNNEAVAEVVLATAHEQQAEVLSAAPPEREVVVNAFLRWLVSMADPGSGSGMTDRRTVTLTQIIDRAADLLDDHSPEREVPSPASVRTAALGRIEQREATPGNPADGPYPASVGEVADELAGLVVELDAGPARGLVRELAARLPEREAPSREAPDQFAGLLLGTAPDGSVYTVQADGVSRIALERSRQVGAEGWSPENDDGHTGGELARAAACYATPPISRELHRRFSGIAPVEWPWIADYWKPEKDRVSELVKAGALIAAEIDRLQRDREGGQE
jgi:hypothetical protein